MARLQSVQIVRQLEHRPHQGIERLPAIFHFTEQQRGSELLHLLGEQRRSLDFDHLQGTVNLMQIGRAKAHLGRVVGISDVRFQGLSRPV